MPGEFITSRFSGTFTTAVMQASAAVIAIVLTALNTQLITFDMGIAMVTGANVDTPGCEFLLALIDRLDGRWGNDFTKDRGVVVNTFEVNRCRHNTDPVVVSLDHRREYFYFFRLYCNRRKNRKLNGQFG